MSKRKHNNNTPAVQRPKTLHAEPHDPDKHQRQLTVRLEQSSHKGPLPSPDVMRAYAEIDPNAVRIILSMAEKSLDCEIQTRDRLIALNEKDQEHEAELCRRGQWWAGIITLASIGAVVWSARYGIGEAIVASFGGVTTIVAHFLQRRNAKAEEKKAAEPDPDQKKIPDKES